MRTPLLVEFYRKLPQPRETDDPELWAAGLPVAIEAFRRQVENHYTESTLQRLLNSPDPMVRRSAVLALSLVGRMTVNTAVAGLLQDEDRLVRQLASDALWAIWFRGKHDDQTLELQRLVRQRDPQRALRGLDTLLKRAGDYAEAHNQRAILNFRLGRYRAAIADCEKVLELNPHHFGAAAGMAQCYMKLKKPRAALRSFRNALRINPNLEDVAETIRALEDVLGEGGR